MSLSNYKAPSHTFETNGGSFDVKGLSLSDVSILVNEHLPDMEAVFDLFSNSLSLNDLQMRAVASSIVATAPGLAANIIAIAAGEYSAAPTAATLPAPLQINIIQKVGDLTFSEVGGVKKGMQAVVGLLMERMTPEAKTGLMRILKAE
jgi:hypothetical protein